MYYTNNMPYYNNNMYNYGQNLRYRRPYYNNRFLGGFVAPFALGFLSAPLLFRPNYYPYYPNYNYPIYY